MKQPNIILISIDTLRADHLSCYGYKRKTTPNIDRLAIEGVLFKNAYSTAVWTPPAHASMLTGLYPSQHGVIHQNRLREDISTIAEIVQRNGYHTAGFVNNSQVGELVGLNRGHDDFYEVWRGFAKEQIFRRVVHKVSEFTGTADHGASQTNHLIFDWLSKRWNREKPFYLFIHYIDAHNPLKAPRPFRFKYLSENLRKRVDMARIWKVANNPLVCFTDNFQLNEAEVEALTCLYDEEINYVDSKIGALVNQLEGMKLLDESFLILTADHGEHLGEHGMYSHAASLYEPIVHIPLILSYPKRTAPQSTSSALVQLVDILPTVLDLTGLKGLNTPGRSLLESLKTGDSSRMLFAEWEGRIPHFVQDRLNGADASPIRERFKDRLWMTRSGDFKLITDFKQRFDLYNIADDPQEKLNLVKKQPEIFNRFKAALEAWKNSEKTARESESYEYADEALRKHLRALGYL